MTEKDKLVEIKIFRFDPTVDKAPRYATYKVPYEGYSLLNALQYIYANYDKSLAFRAGCSGKGSGRCGACPVLVNGVAALSCERMMEAGLVVEPHPKFELIKDLAVDLHSKKGDYKASRKSTVQHVIDIEKCVGCNDCVVVCPVGVYELQKVGGKYKAFAVDAASCCGLTCEMCVDACYPSAIKVKPASKKAKA